MSFGLSRGGLGEGVAPFQGLFAGDGEVMVSWQAHLTAFLLRHCFKPWLEAASTPAKLRALMSSPTGFMLPAGVRITKATLGGIPGEWVEPRAQPTHRLLLYIHGGGFVACSPRTHRPISSAFAQQGFRVFVPDYRLAPEHPFPAGLMDVIAAYRALRATAGRACEVTIAGDSAGGGLAVAALIALRDTNEKLPGAAALFSPFANLFEGGGSRRTNEKSCALLTGKTLARFAQLYLGSCDPRSPLTSPIFGNLEGLPPLLIQVAADETLLDDSICLAHQARKARVQVELLVWPGVPHAFPLFQHLIPEGRRSLAAAGKFLRSVSAQGT